MRRRAFDPYPRAEPQPKMVAGATRPVSRVNLENAGSFDPEKTENTGNGYNNAHGLYFQDRRVTDWTLEFLREKGRTESYSAPWVAHIECGTGDL